MKIKEVYDNDYRYVLEDPNLYISDNFIIQDYIVMASIYDLKTDELVYKGILENGMKHGFVIEYSKRHVIYKGEFLNGLRHGQGSSYYESI